jgi:very-short-patch-repair endonuclease
MSARMLDRTIRGIIERDGWRPGTSLENRVALRLSKWAFAPGDFIQQMPVGAYRIDFAAPDVKVGIEADGWHHFTPLTAAKDAERDSWLRAQGWAMFRVDFNHGEEGFLQSLCRASTFIRHERAMGYPAYQDGTAARRYYAQQARLAKKAAAA